MLAPVRSRRALGALVAGAVLAGVLAPAPAGVSAQDGRRTLAVAAAADLKPALEVLARRFEAEHRDVAVRITTGASGTFFAQIRNGAPFDVFFSADREYPRRLVGEGLTAGPDTVYAIGTLVLWIPASSSLDPARRGLAALLDPAIRKLAMANPALAPYGRAAEAALRSAGVYDAVRPRLVLGESVSQAAAFAASGAVDAALLPRSLTISGPLAAGRTWIVPPASYPPHGQSVVVIRRAREPELAGAFLGFVTGPAGREILARSGFALP